MHNCYGTNMINTAALFEHNYHTDHLGISVKRGREKRTKTRRERQRVTLRRQRNLRRS